MLQLCSPRHAFAICNSVRKELGVLTFNACAVIFYVYKRFINPSLGVFTSDATSSLRLLNKPCLEASLSITQAQSNDAGNNDPELEQQQPQETKKKSRLTRTECIVCFKGAREISMYHSQETQGIYFYSLPRFSVIQ